MEDKLIIKKIKRKNEKGLEGLIDKYGGFIKAIIRQKLYDLSNYEEECMDDVLMSIWNNIHRFDEKKNTFKNWIASVTRYRIIDYNRKYLRNREYISTLDSEETHEKHLIDKAKVDENILTREFRNEIEDLLDNLKPRDKELFIKHYLEDKTVDNISKEMGVKSEATYNRLSRGRIKLRKIFSEGEV